MTTAPFHVPVLHERQAFERSLTRALWLGPLLGLSVRFALSRVGISDSSGFLGLAAVLLGIGLSVCLDAGDTLDRALLAALALLPPLVWLVGSLRGHPPLWPFIAAAFLLGLIPVRAQRCRRGVEGGVARARPSAWHDLAGGAASVVLATVGFVTGSRIGAALDRMGAPEELQFSAIAFCLSLFAGLGALAAHLWLIPDPLEQRAEALLRQLPSTLTEPVRRALIAYRACGELLAALPRHSARDELAQTMSRLTCRILDGAEAWGPLADQVGPDARATLTAQATALSERASRASDPIARSHLDRAASALGEEALRVAALEVERDRDLARLEADAALLEHARIALLNAGRGLRARERVEVEALSRRLKSLSARQHAEHVGIDAPDSPPVCGARNHDSVEPGHDRDPEGRELPDAT